MPFANLNKLKVEGLSYFAAAHLFLRLNGKLTGFMIIMCRSNISVPKLKKLMSF